MTALFTLALIVFVGLSVAALVGFLFFFLRVVFWVLFFPFRFLFKLVWVPIALALGALGLVFSSVAYPAVLLLAGGVALVVLIALVASVLLPLLPFLLLGFLVWAIFGRRPAAI